MDCSGNRVFGLQSARGRDQTASKRPPGNGRLLGQLLGLGGGSGQPIAEECSTRTRDRPRGGRDPKHPQRSREGDRGGPPARR